MRRSYFHLCTAILVLSIFFCATVVLHRHRLQVLRRIFAIIGSVFLLRSRPMLMFTITSSIASY